MNIRVAFSVGLWRCGALLVALGQAAYADSPSESARIPARDQRGKQDVVNDGEHDSSGYLRALFKADAHLANGEAALAAADYEHAAQTDGEHVEAEVAISRAYMAAGEFRRALAYARLVSGEHQQSDAALAWNAYLEDRAGYVDHAVGRLRAASSQQPGATATRAALTEILLERGQSAEANALLGTASESPDTTPEDFERLGRRAARALPQTVLSADHTARNSGTIGLPQSVDYSHLSPPLVDTARTLWQSAPFRRWPSSFGAAIGRSNGVVVGAGNAVLTRLNVSDGGEVYVRNGLGHVRHGVVARQMAGITLLQLDAAYPEAAHVIGSAENHAPDGVRFCFVLGYALLDGESPSYPFVTPGTVVRDKVGIDALMQITVPLGPDQGGSAVFDSGGRLIGLAVGDGDTIADVEDRDRDLGAIHLAVRGDAFSGLLSSESEPAPRAPVASLAVEELYERLLPAVVEVWVLAKNRN